MSGTATTTPGTMFEDVIATVRSGPQAGASERALLSAAMAVRDAMPTLDRAERMEIEAMLAVAVHRWSDELLAAAPLTTARSPERDLCDHAWSRVRSAYSLRHRIGHGVEATVQATCDAVHGLLAAYEAAARASRYGTAAKRLRAMMEQQAALHPRLGLSFGYIGNCAVGGYDDRSWKVFSRLATSGCRNACDVSYGGHATTQLGKLMQQAERELAAWCDEQERRLDAGEIRIVG